MLNMNQTRIPEVLFHRGYMQATLLAAICLLSLPAQVSIASSMKITASTTSKKNLEASLTSIEQLLGLPRGLLRAICTVESGLRPLAHIKEPNGTVSTGMCQVQVNAYMDVFNIRHISAKKKVAVKRELLKPGSNAFVAGLYLKKQYERYKCWDKATVAYNAGRYIKSKKYLHKVKRELYAP